MDPRLNLIIQNFELRKLDRRCNDKNCGKIPSKRVLISETDKMTTEKRELVVLNLCTEHFEKIKSFLRELVELTARDKVINIETFETGYVTY